MKILAPECFDAQDRLDTTCTKLQDIESFFASDDELMNGGDLNEDLYYEIYGEESPLTLSFSVNGLQYLVNLKSLSLGFGNTSVSAKKIHLPKSLRSVYAYSVSYYTDEYQGFGIEMPDSVTWVGISGGGYEQGGSIGCILPSQLEELEVYGSNNISGIMNTKVKKITSEAINVFESNFSVVPNTLEEIKFSNIYYNNFDQDDFNPKLPQSLPSLKKLTFEEVRFEENNGFLNTSNMDQLEELSFIYSEGYDLVNYPSRLKRITYDGCIDYRLGYPCEKSPNINYEFPEGLESLNISNLPELEYIEPTYPPALQNITLSNINISVLTAIPSTLKTLDISKNKLEVLASIPAQLDTLNVSGNSNLKCLPTLPASLKSINVSGTKINCIPNETDQLKATIALPLCPNPCGDTPDLLAGYVYLDYNKNGKFDGSDVKVQGAFIQANDKILTSNSKGEYRFYVNPDEENKISVTYNHPHLDKILPAQRTYTNSGNSEKIDTLNFAVQLKDVNDIEVLITPFTARNGFTPQVNITVTNRGTVFANKINLSLQTPVDWTIQNTTPVAQNISDSILWNNINLDRGQSKTFKAKITVPSSLPINTPYAIKAKVQNVVDDFSPENNTYTYSSVIRGSYDPNDKLVTPEVLAPNYAEGTELLYTVRFQNTGNDTAFKVVVVDTILENLDPLSLRMIESSHSVEWYLNENREVSFIFDNILLPDSNVNEAASHGYVTFAIQPLPNLASGTAIENRAGIYFDFNAPIITNYATSNVDIITLINEKSALQLNVYPNPTKDILNIRWAEGGKTNISISDISGKIIFQSTEVGNFKQLPTQNFSKGMYIIQIQNEKGLGLSKIIIQ